MTTYYFTNPTVSQTPPLSVADKKDGPPIEVTNPLGARLWRFYESRLNQVVVFKMSDGTYQVNRQVPGLSSSIKVEEPYPAVPFDTSSQGIEGIFNHALAWSWSYLGGQEFPIPTPTVSLIYWTGTTQVSSAEASSLIAAGFGAYVTSH